MVRGIDIKGERKRTAEKTRQRERDRDQRNKKGQSDESPVRNLRNLRKTDTGDGATIAKEAEKDKQRAT